VEVKGKTVILVRTTDKKVVAFSPICPHEKCPVTYEADKKVFACTCHSSTFDMTGKSLGGPAKNPLTRYATALKEDKIIVELPK
jgi:Rieske Fe-S protein